MEKTKIKKKEDANGPFFKNTKLCLGDKCTSNWPTYLDMTNLSSELDTYPLPSLSNTRNACNEIVGIVRFKKLPWTLKTPMPFVCCFGAKLETWHVLQGKNIPHQCPLVQILSNSLLSFIFSLSSLCSIPLINLSFYRWEWNPGLHHFPPSLLRFDGSHQCSCVLNIKFTRYAYHRLDLYLAFDQTMA